MPIRNSFVFTNCYSRAFCIRYVDEFAFRLNDGNVKRHTMERLESFVSGTKGKRLTYKALIQ